MSLSENSYLFFPWGAGVISDIGPHHVTTIWLVLGVLGDQISIELAD